MAKLKGRIRKERICCSLDVDVLLLARSLKENNGWSLSETIEMLMLYGLKNPKLNGDVSDG